MLLATRKSKNNLVRTLLASSVLISSMAYINTAYALNDVVVAGGAIVPATGADNYNFTGNGTVTVADTIAITKNGGNASAYTSGGSGIGAIIFAGDSAVAGSIGLVGTGPLRLLEMNGAVKTVGIGGGTDVNTVTVNTTGAGAVNFKSLATHTAVTVTDALVTFTVDGNFELKDVTVATFAGDVNIAAGGSLALTETASLTVTGASTLNDADINLANQATAVFTGNVTTTGNINTLGPANVAGLSSTLTFNGVANFATAIAANTSTINFNGGGTAAAGVTLADDSRVNFNASYAINGADLARNNKSIIGIKTGATVTVAADMSNADAGSQLIFDLGNTITPGTFAVTGAATIVDDQFVTIENYNLGLLGVGATETKNLVTSVGGVVTRPTLIAPNNVFINFTLDIPNANTLNLVMTRQVPAGLEGNSNSLAQILAQMDQTNVDGALEGLLDGVGDIAKTLDDLNEELAEIAPQGINGGISNSVMNMTNETFDLFSQRIGELRAGLDSYHTGYAAGHMDEKGHGTWVKIFGNHADQSKRGNIAGYTGETWGIAGGADLMLTERHLVGVSASWGSTNVNFDSQRGGTDINSYQGAFYGSWNIKTPLFFNWMASGAYNKYKETQIVSTGGFNQTSLGDFKGWNYGARGELGYVFGEESFHITPTLGLTYSHVSFDSFRQRGVSTANQIIDYGSVSALLAGAGVKFSYDCEMEKALLQPEVHTNVSYDILGEEMDANARFVGFATSYNVSGASVQRTDYNVGASLTTWGNSGLGMSISYDYDWKSNYHAHSGFVRVRYEW